MKHYKIEFSYSVDSSDNVNDIFIKVLKKEIKNYLRRINNGKEKEMGN